MLPLTTIGKYEIVDTLGTGGMGTVYRAYDPTLERIVAVKVLKLDAAEVSAAELGARFRNEARAVARLNHPAIVAIFDYDDKDPAGTYIAMEYVNGCALDLYVKQHPELSLGDMIGAMQQVLAGLDYAHRHEVVHRDVKPSNLLVTRDGRVKITDFGIAKIGPRSTLHTGFLVGTPQYMAPEQYTDGQIDHHCDIHAAAVVLYELMTGAAPFSGNPAEIMRQVCYETPPALSTVNPQIPAAFDAIVAKALEKNPANRYVSALQFQEALRAITQSISWKSTSPIPVQRPRVTTATMRRVPVATAPANPPPAQNIAAPPAPEAPSVAPTGAGNVPQQVLREPPPVRTQVIVPDVPLPPPGAVSVPRQALREPPPMRTQVIAPDVPLPPPTAAAPRTPQQTRPDSSGQRPLASWSREQLTEIERQLTQIVGPVAKVLVQSAAANTANRRQLYAMLAEQLHTPEERRRFLALEAGAVTPHPHTAPATAPAAPGSQGARPLTPETLQRATELLARYVGPMASILTKKAAQAAVDEPSLYSLLASKLSDPGERARFMRDAQRSSSDRIRPRES